MQRDLASPGPLLTGLDHETEASSVASLKAANDGLSTSHFWPYDIAWEREGIPTTKGSGVVATS